MKFKITFALSCSDGSVVEEARDVSAEAADDLRSQTGGFRHIDTEVQEVGEDRYELQTLIEVTGDQAETFDFSGYAPNSLSGVGEEKVTHAVALTMDLSLSAAVADMDGISLEGRTIEAA